MAGIFLSIFGKQQNSESTWNGDWNTRCCITSVENRKYVVWVRQSLEAWRRILQLRDVWFCHRHLHHYKGIQMFALHHHLAWGTVKKMPTILPKTFTGSTSGSQWVFILCYHHKITEDRVSSFNTTRRACAGWKSGQQPSKAWWFWRQILCEGKNTWSWDNQLLRQSPQQEKAAQIPPYWLKQKKQGTEEGLDVGAAQEANPPVFHNDICSPGKHSQGTQTSFLIHSAFIFSFKKWSRDTWIFILW